MKNIPVIFVTAMSDVEDETKGFQAGGVLYHQTDKIAHCQSQDKKPP